MRSFVEKKLQHILNHTLMLDSESEQRLEQLNEKIVTIELLGINYIFQLYFHNKKIQLRTTELKPPHTHIRGTPLALLQMSLTPENRKQFFAEDISIKGDIECGQKVVELFDMLEIDWEEYLSHWIGDFPARQAGRVATKIKKFSKTLRTSLLQNIREYVHEEINLFPPTEEIQDFYQDVDNLRMDTDRLEARINYIIKSLEAKKEG